MAPSSPPLILPNATSGEEEECIDQEQPMMNLREKQEEGSGETIPISDCSWKNSLSERNSTYGVAPRKKRIDFGELTYFHFHPYLRLTSEVVPYEPDYMFFDHPIFPLTNPFLPGRNLLNDEFIQNPLPVLPQDPYFPNKFQEKMMVKENPEIYSSRGLYVGNPSTTNGAKDFGQGGDNGDGGEASTSGDKEEIDLTLRL